MASGSTTAALEASAAAATNQALRGLTFTGPIALLLFGLAYGLIAAAVAITIDVLRRPATHFPRPFWRWIWLVPQLGLLVFTLLRFVGGPRMTGPVAGIILLWGVLCLFFDIGYLLEVVFPGASGRERRGCAAGDAAPKGDDAGTGTASTPGDVPPHDGSKPGDDR